MKSEADFKSGETCLYHEDGHITRCEILAHEVKDGHLRLTLKVIENIHDSKHIFGPAPVSGEIYSVEKKLDLPGDFGGLMWRIEEDPKN